MSENKNRIAILLNEYSNFYLGAIRLDGLQKALKTLPPDMILEKNEIVSSGPGLPPTMRDKTVEMRLVEVDRDHKILKARLQVVKEMLETEPGGKESLEKWVWEKPKEE